MLSGLRVVELSDPSGWLAGRMLADLGADVTLIADEQLRETHPYEWAAFNAGKHLAAYDDSLPASADVVIETGVTQRYENLGNDRVVWCALTPFGRTGPKADLRASDLSVQAQSGVMYMTGDPDRAPVACSAPTSSHHGCADAVAGIMAALLQREKTGRGQLVDVSMQEAHLMATMSRVGQWSIVGGRGKRAGGLMRVGDTVQREIWPCKDGFVSFGLRGGPARIPGLKRMVAWMDEDGLATPPLLERDWDTYNHNLLSQQEVQEISEPIAAFFMTKTMTELYDAALTRGLMLAPANTAREILASRQYASRALFTEIEDASLGRIPLVRSFVVSDAVPGVRKVAP
ncbi:MAG TPA: CoA transferase [Actinomycetota bacterium]|nr:CoA transferase [Actinomycetota bacterium]